MWNFGRHPSEWRRSVSKCVRLMIMIASMYQYCDVCISYACVSWFALCCSSALLDQAMFDIFDSSLETMNDKHERMIAWTDRINNLLYLVGRISIIDPITWVRPWNNVVNGIIIFGIHSKGKHLPYLVHRWYCFVKCTTHLPNIKYTNILESRALPLTPIFWQTLQQLNWKRTEHWRRKMSIPTINSLQLSSRIMQISGAERRFTSERHDTTSQNVLIWA